MTTIAAWMISSFDITALALRDNGYKQNRP